jgi:hypothetical protein
VGGQVTNDPFTSDAATAAASDAGAKESQTSDPKTPSEGSASGSPDDVDEEPAEQPSVNTSPTLPSDRADAGVSLGQAPDTCFWGPCCPFGLTLCGDACVDVLTALSHCGKCDRACKPGLLCLAGVCCGEGELLCDDRCVNPLKDTHNCGSCGHECEHGPCKDGLCRRDP